MTVKLCECGCGNPAPIAERTVRKMGWIKGEPKRFIQHHHLTGVTNPRYKGGIYLAKRENRWVIICRDGSRELYARAVMEAKLRRRLKDDECVHHIDGNTTNDAPDNLENMNYLDHNLLSATKYNPEILLDFLKKFWQEHKRTPRYIDFIKGKSLPHPSTYRRIFGKWNNALRLAGIPIHRESRWCKK